MISKLAHKKRLCTVYKVMYVLLTSFFLRDYRLVLSRGDRRCGFVGLTCGPVEGHDPVVGVSLVLGGEENAVALPDKVEEVLPALKIWWSGGGGRNKRRKGIIRDSDHGISLYSPFLYSIVWGSRFGLIPYSLSAERGSPVSRCGKTKEEEKELGIWTQEGPIV